MSAKIIVQNSTYKLKKIHPIILQNDKDLLYQYIKEKINNNSRNQKFYFHNSTSPQHINIKALISPNSEKINIFKKTTYLDNEQNAKILKNPLYSFNNNSNLNIRKNLFQKQYNIYLNRKNTMPNKLFNEINKAKCKINKSNKSTNISNEFNKLKNNTHDKDENKISSFEKSESYNSRLCKPKPFIFDNIKYKFKKNKKNISSKNDLKDINKNFINRMNFITNIKSANRRINNDEKEKQNNFNFKTFNTENLEKMTFKKNIVLESLKDNIIWNDYINLEKNKQFQQLKNKRKMKEDINNIIKLFRNSYSFKKYRNKNKLNKKEKYLNFLEDLSLGLRENLIKNYMQDDRGGKQNIRKIYNPIITYN